MKSKHLCITLLLAIAVVGPAVSFEPVVVGGGGLAFTVSGTPTSQVTGIEARPRLSVGWRERIGDAGYVNLNARGTLLVPLTVPATVTDGENLSIELGLPTGNNEVFLRAALESTLVAQGVFEPRVVPRWSMDFRFLNERGWLALQSQGRYRYDAANTTDALVQRIGLGYVRNESIRFAFDGNVMAGYELWPDYAVVDGLGAATGENRADVIIQLDGGAEGLWGYFTTWDLSAAAEGRFSNATRYLPLTGEFEADAESRLSAITLAALRTSPLRQLGMSGEFSVRADWYLGREARDADGQGLGETLVTTALYGSFEVDYSPLPNLYLVGSVRGGATLSRDPAYRNWTVSAELGIEYSF